MEIISKEDISKIAGESYGIVPQVVDKSAWGYSTVAYYVESAEQKKYIVKAALFSDDKLKRAKKDTALSEILRNDFPTPVYFKNSSGEYITVTNNIILRVAKYIEGTAPFDMNLQIFEQVIEYLHRIHSFDLKKINIELPELNVPGKKNVLLHGDLTASNIIVANNVIVGLMDFEDSLLGPAEYDLARSAVFCWFRFKETPFQTIFDVAKKELDSKLFLNFCLQHAENHLNQVIKNKSKYDDDVFWNDDYNFSKKAVEEIKKTII